MLDAKSTANLNQLDRLISKYIERHPEEKVKKLCDALVCCIDSYLSTYFLNEPCKLHAIKLAYILHDDGQIVFQVCEYNDALAPFKMGISSNYIIPIYKYFAECKLRIKFYYTAGSWNLHSIGVAYSPDIDPDDANPKITGLIDLIECDQKCALPLDSTWNCSNSSLEGFAKSILEFLGKDAISIAAKEDSAQFITWLNRVVPFLETGGGECRGYVNKHGSFALEFLTPSIGSKIANKFTRRGFFKEFEPQGVDDFEQHGRYIREFRKYMAKYGFRNFTFYDNIANLYYNKESPDACPKFVEFRNSADIPSMIDIGPHIGHNCDEMLPVTLTDDCVAMDSPEFKA